MLRGTVSFSKAVWILNDSVTDAVQTRLKDVEYVSGGVCHRIKDCPLTKRRRHRDIAAGENMLLKGQWHLRTGRKDWK